MGPVSGSCLPQPIRLSQVPLTGRLVDNPPTPLPGSTLQRPAFCRCCFPWALPHKRACCLFWDLETWLYGDGGSIVADFDPDLKTNQSGKMPEYEHEVEYGTPISFKKGDDFGYFNFGSTMVVIFEAPSDLDLRPSETVKMGEPLLV